MRNLFILAFVLFLGLEAQAQRFGYVDTEYILSQMPEYRSAQKQLDEFAEKWQSEIEQKNAEIDRLTRNLQAERVLLTEDDVKKREKEIEEKNQALRDFQNEKFGFEGELFRKRQELIRPLQDRVFDAVQKVAKESNLDFIFDKSGGLTMLYTNAKFDRTDEVLEELGIAPRDAIQEDTPKKK